MPLFILLIFLVMMLPVIVPMGIFAHAYWKTQERFDAAIERQQAQVEPAEDLPPTVIIDSETIDDDDWI